METRDLQGARLCALGKKISSIFESIAAGSVKSLARPHWEEGRRSLTDGATLSVGERAGPDHQRLRGRERVAGMLSWAKGWAGAGGRNGRVLWPKHGEGGGLARG